MECDQELGWSLGPDPELVTADEMALIERDDSIALPGDRDLEDEIVRSVRELGPPEKVERAAVSRCTQTVQHILYDIKCQRHDTRPLQHVFVLEEQGNGQAMREGAGAHE